VIEVRLACGLIARVDDEDAELVLQYPWHKFRSHKTIYAQACTQKPSGEPTAVYMHHMILGPAEHNRQVDHRDLDGLNNQRSNLRWATRSQQGGNQGLRSSNTSGFKGVWFNKTNRNWVAEARCEGKKVHIGVFQTPEDAARAYDRKAAELFGEFARLNFG
jgi:hypothetical protein